MKTVKFGRPITAKQLKESGVISDFITEVLAK